MRYSLGDNLADYGFSFLEKLHSPIFLLHKSGTIKKVNAAGRKLLSVAHITVQELEKLGLEMVSLSLNPQQVEYQRYSTKRKHIKVISKKLQASDYYLVELIR